MTATWGQPIRTTSSGELNALAFQDIKVWTCDRQIRDMLRQRYGDGVVLCFANPIENRANGNIDWYCPIQGNPVPVTELSEELREKITEHLQAVAHEVDSLAEDLIRSGEPLKVTRGNILKRALIYPDESYIYAIDEQPVITGWGFAPGTPGVEGKNLMRLALPPQTSPASRNEDVMESPARKEDHPVLPVPVRTGSGCLWLFWWLLPLLALLLLLFLLFTSFGPVSATGGKDIFHLDGKPFMAPLPDTTSDTDALKRNIKELELQLANHIAQCKPVTEKPAQAEPEKQTPKALEIPEDAKNLDFLSGRWLCETGLANNRTGEPIKVFFTFDSNGKGSATVIEQNNQCEGPATARLKNGKLLIDQGKLQCQHGNAYYSETIINCENTPERETHCSGKNYDGTRWDASFLKLR